jgi:ribonuclease P protein component
LAVAKSWRLAARRDAIASRPNKPGAEAERERRQSGGLRSVELEPRPPQKAAATKVKLARKADFDAVYRHGKRRSNSHFTVFTKANQLPQSRFGFSIKRALGGAVVRNRIRRRIREIVRLHRQEIPTGWDIVIHPKPNVATAPFAALTADLLKLLTTP